MSEGNWATTCPTCKTRYKWQGAMHPPPPCPKCSKALRDVEQRQQQQSAQPAGVGDGKSVRVPLAKEKNESYDEAIELCDEIESLASEVPERGQDFASSVCEKAASIRESVEEHETATATQIQALENMRDGLSRWIH